MVKSYCICPKKTKHKKSKEKYLRSYWIEFKTSPHVVYHVENRKATVLYVKKSHKMALHGEKMHKKDVTVIKKNSSKVKNNKNKSLGYFVKTKGRV